MIRFVHFLEFLLRIYIKMRFNSSAFLDIDECKERVACQCPDCSCKNLWGSYECTCRGDLLYIHEHDTCISKYNHKVYVSIFSLKLN